MCGTSMHLDDDKLASGMRDIAAQVGFAAQWPVLEMRGQCR